MLYDPHLDLFLQVAELGSFSKAAEAGYITPSAVIKQINLLEDELGVRLFERTYKGLKLTKAGESLKKDAPELIRMSREAASRAISSMKSDEHISPKSTATHRRCLTCSSVSSPNRRV